MTRILILRMKRTCRIAVKDNAKGCVKWSEYYYLSFVSDYVRSSSWVAQTAWAEVNAWNVHSMLLWSPLSPWRKGRRLTYSENMETSRANSVSAPSQGPTAKRRRVLPTHLRKHVNSTIMLTPAEIWNAMVTWIFWCVPLHDAVSCEEKSSKNSRVLHCRAARCRRHGLIR